jgi:hypothetical protein
MPCWQVTAIFGRVACTRGIYIDEHASHIKGCAEAEYLAKSFFLTGSKALKLLPLPMEQKLIFDVSIFYLRTIVFLWVISVSNCTVKCLPTPRVCAGNSCVFAVLLVPVLGLAQKARLRYINAPAWVYVSRRRPHPSSLSWKQIAQPGVPRIILSVAPLLLIKG